MADTGDREVRPPLGGLHLTDLAREAIGRPAPVRVPLLDLPWRDDRRDRRPTFHVHIDPPESPGSAFARGLAAGYAEGNRRDR